MTSNWHFNSETHLRILAAGFARALLRLSALSNQEGAGKAGCRLGTRGPLCAAHLERTAQRHTGAAGHPAFPARWVDGLCRALPGDEFFLSPSPCELTMHPGPVEPKSISARLDRSNDGQDHTVLPYARLADWRAIQRRSSARGYGLTGTTRPARTISCPTLPRPPQPTPRS